MHANAQPRDLCCPRVELTVRVRVLLWMHHLEWMNAGNSGKLLLATLGDAAQLFLYGRKEDDERLRQEVQRDPANTLLLFPGPGAISCADFLARSGGSQQVGEHRAGEAEDGTEDRTTSVVVVDATYRKAKNMAKHFARRIDPSGGVAQVALQPEAASVLARAQKQYAQAAGGATDLGRISTAEAVALFLRECGEAADKVESLVECVRLDATRAAARE